MQPQHEIVFGGIDPRDDDAHVPDWYRTAVDAERGASVEYPTFQEAVQSLPRNTKVTAGYYDPEADEWVADERSRALVNPEWLGEGRDDAPQDTAMWDMVTDTYSPVNPMDMYGPLVAAIRRSDAGTVFGRIETTRNGGDVAVEILFDDIRSMDPADGEMKFIFGFQTGYDYFRNTRLYAEPMAYDVSEHTPMRRLGDTRKRTHVGKASTTVAEWWEDGLDVLDHMGDTLFEVITEASNYEIDIASLPVTLAEFLESMGFPTEYAEDAASRARPVGPRHTYDAWSLYHATVGAVEDGFDGKMSGKTLAAHINRANDILYQPPKAEERALESVRSSLRGQGTLDIESDDDAADYIDDRLDTVADRIGAFESKRERLKALMDEAKKMEDDGDEAEA